jgi:hypothetical protein
MLAVHSLIIMVRGKGKKNEKNGNTWNKKYNENIYRLYIGNKIMSLTIRNKHLFIYFTIDAWITNKIARKWEGVQKNFMEIKLLQGSRTLSGWS